MKKASEILKMPILCIQEGLELVNAASMIINPKNANVDYLIVDDGQWYSGIKVLPFQKILSMGNDVITTNSIKSINAPDESAYAVLKEDVKLTQTRVFNEKGKFLGKIEDYSIDESSGKIVQFVLDDEGSTEIEGANFITLGKDITVVGENFSTNEDTSNDSSTESQEKPSDSHSVSFDGKQRAFLLGRTSTKTIINEGKTIVKEGSVIDEETIDTVIAAGRITELITNTKA